MGKNNKSKNKNRAASPTKKDVSKDLELLEEAPKQIEETEETEKNEETIETKKSEEAEKTETASEDAEDKAKKKQIADKKKRLKKSLKTVLIVFLSLGLLVVVLPAVVRWLHPADQTVEYEDWQFFEPDYDKNIFEDEVYMSLNRNIYFDRGGREVPVTPLNRAELDPAAGFFYDYINCIIRGDYETYPSFYTDECKSDPNFKCPEEFTMQGIYDIKIHFLNFEYNEDNNPVSELYEVSYRIFENNGTYRRDILPDEPRTRIFEITLDGGPMINSITYLKVEKD